MNCGHHVMTALLADSSSIPFSDRARRDFGTSGTFARRRRLCQLLLQCLAERYEVGIQRDAEIAEFDHIEAAYAALDIAHEVLHHAEFRRQIFLPHAASAPQVAKQLAQALVFDAMDGFAHGRCQWERSWTLYCRFVFTNLVYLARALLGYLASSCKGEAGEGLVGIHIGTRVMGSCATRCRKGQGECVETACDAVPIFP